MTVKKVRRAFLCVVVFLLAAVTVWILIGNWLAGRRERAVSRSWGDTLAPLDSFPGRYPGAGPNASALRLEELAAKLGISLAPENTPSRPQPSETDRRAFNGVAGELASYMKTQLEKPSADVDPLPEKLSVYLALQAENLGALRKHVLSSEAPLWEMDVSQPAVAPLPPFGQIPLQRLLVVDALEKTRLGKTREALDDLETSWKVNCRLRERPEMISQVMASRVASWQAGVLRKIQSAPTEWQKRLVEYDYRRSFLVSLQGEAWAASAYVKDWRPPGLLGRLGAPILRPYARLCAVSSAETIRLEVAELQKQDPCSFDPAALDRIIATSLPRWNILGRIAASNYSKPWRRAVRLSIDNELTQKILLIRERRATSRLGGWPREVTRLDSSVCSGAKWTYQVLPDGGMLVSFSRKLEWPPEGGELPLTFTEKAARK